MTQIYRYVCREIRLEVYCNPFNGQSQRRAHSTYVCSTNIFKYAFHMMYMLQ